MILIQFLRWKVNIILYLPVREQLMMKNRLGSNSELQWYFVPTISTNTDLILPIQVFYKSLLWQGNCADSICPIFFSPLFQLLRVRTQVLQRGAIQPDNYNKSLTKALQAGKLIFTIISLLARFFLITPVFFFLSSNRLLKCHAKWKLINKYKLLIICSLCNAALQHLMRCPIQIADFDFLFGTTITPFPKSLTLKHTRQTGNVK